VDAAAQGCRLVGKPRVAQLRQLPLDGRGQPRLEDQERGEAPQQRGPRPISGFRFSILDWPHGIIRPVIPSIENRQSRIENK
jgi:hypothetical protein